MQRAGVFASASIQVSCAALHAGQPLKLVQVVIAHGITY